MRRRQPRSVKAEIIAAVGTVMFAWIVAALRSHATAIDRSNSILGWSIAALKDRVETQAERIRFLEELQRIRKTEERGDLDI